MKKCKYEDCSQSVITQPLRDKPPIWVGRKLGNTFVQISDDCCVRRPIETGTPYHPHIQLDVCYYHDKKERELIK